MVDENESNSVTKPSDTYQKRQRKHEVEREGGNLLIDQPFSWSNVVVCQIERGRNTTKNRKT